eukprot:GHUV01050150.1.p1 GENE.GHUV01050150.1~~GHUV01050150.1.p1  ORF type:complete len:103 (-),score=14.39 GHUV01050150.1:106-414(-)
MAVSACCAFATACSLAFISSLTMLLKPPIGTFMRNSAALLYLNGPAATFRSYSSRNLGTTATQDTDVNLNMGQGSLGDNCPKSTRGPPERSGGHCNFCPDLP